MNVNLIRIFWKVICNNGKQLPGDHSVKRVVKKGVAGGWRCSVNLPCTSKFLKAAMINCVATPQPQTTSDVLRQNFPV